MEIICIILIGGAVITLMKIFGKKDPEPTEKDQSFVAKQFEAQLLHKPGVIMFDDDD